MLKPFSSDVHIPAFDGGMGVSEIKKSKTEPLYVYRSVVNTKEISDWATAQGFTSVTSPEQLHVTVIYSKAPVDWFKLGEGWQMADKLGNIEIKPGGPRAVERLGDKGAVVLMFASSDLSWRNRSAMEQGASWDYEEYQPHITITYNAPADLDLDKVIPYRGKIVLGPEIFEPLQEGWRPTEMAKVNEELGIVFGFAVVCKKNGQDYYDQNYDKKTKQHVPEHVTEDAMLKFSADFMEKSRASNAEHDGEDVGEYIFGFPLTTDIAKAMDISSDKTGFMVGFKPKDKATLAKFKDGTFNGFSIEGSRVKYHEVENA